MKSLLLFAVSAIVMLYDANAQQGELLIKKGSKGLYLDHNVAPKEGLYSIGRLYNVNPKFIAAYNGIDLNKGLNIGQVIQIPLTDTNFSQKTNKGIPVYYVSETNENLVKISNANNKVLLKDLRSWNKLKNDNVAAGSKLVVGFLQSKGMTAVPANTTAIQQPPVKKEDNPVVKKADPVDQKSIAKNTSVEDKSVTKTKQGAPPENKPVVKDTPAAEKTIVKTEPVKEKEIVPEIKDEPKQTEAVFAKEVTVVNPTDQGYFKKSFEQQVKTIPTSKEATVTAGIFKTSSGWQDGKYYLLIDGVATGTIVKLINPENNKAVYAKVLGQMNGIRQNQGLDIRISNAAASTLEIPDTEKFTVKVNY